MRAVKPKLTEEAMGSLPLVGVGVELEFVAEGVVPLEDEVELVELEFLAAARKAAKVLLPVVGALIAMTIPATQ